MKNSYYDLMKEFDNGSPLSNSDLDILLNKVTVTLGHLEDLRYSEYTLVVNDLLRRKRTLEEYAASRKEKQ